ncbi:type II toxin-antitoxin system Phd/YefM family antitoxin [Pseudonocardia sp. CA-107938]|uniref:type II toxin-antitoxin system Phd/YefM family antitoxin n=1 Tax=Pseudonocardia sp. CA-107938 TaxID=3240021 RepID=UPI003D8D5BB1
MGETIRQSDLRRNTAAILRRVAAGESFTVTVHGRAVADLVPHQREQPKRRFVPLAEINALLAMDNPDPVLWRQDMERAEAETFAEDDWDDPWERAQRQQEERRNQQ